MDISSIDKNIIVFFKKIQNPFARFSIFIIFFWFGLLKLFGLSPANPLVSNLLEKTLPFIRFSDFIIMLGIIEVLIGIGFLIPKLTRIVILVLFFHMITTVMPLFLLPQIAWSGFLMPTIEGQYMIKNILIIALAITIGSRLTPLKSK